MLETVKEMAEAWLKQIIESASSLKEVEDKVINELLPKLIESVREVANETSEAARKVRLMQIKVLGLCTILLKSISTRYNTVQFFFN